MTILCHRQQLSFVNHGTWDGKSKTYKGGDASTIAVSPKPGLQELPDWVRNTATFKAAVKAGLIVEVAAVAQPEAAPAPEPTPAPKPAAPAPAKAPRAAKAEPTGLSAGAQKAS